jgi:cell wall-associated NlpC family hydrolase
MGTLKAQCAKYVGVPFLERGATPDGWDCWGLVQWIARNDLGKDWPSYEEVYARLASYDKTNVEAVTSLVIGEWMRLTAPLEGCVVGFDKRGVAEEPRLYHVGLVLNDSEMLHVQKNAIGGTVIVPFRSFSHGAFIAGFWERL